MKKTSSSRVGRPGVTFDDVRNAAERLRQQGRKVGPVNVRLELGRGSYETIQRHLRQLSLAAPKPSKD